METENKTNLNKRQQIKLIKEISQKLTWALDNISWTNYYTDYLKENIREEKNHRVYKPDGIQSGLTVNEAGQFFAVQQIIRYLQGEESPDIAIYLFMRKTVFTAYSLVAQYRDKIEEALKGTDYTEVIKMDYCYLVNVDNNGNTLN